jgi:HK97 family phage major capsid protein
MTYSNITGDTAYLPMPAMVPGYNPYRWDPATFLTSANVRSTASARISYVDEGAGEGTPATTTEGNEKPQIDIDNVVAYSSAIKVAAHLKVSDEMLQDIPYLSGQINDNLTTRVRLAASNNIRTYITGLSGILTAVDATMAGLAGSDAQIWQLAVMAQQTIAKSNHSCTHLFLNPTDYARLIALKGINNAPIIVGATSANVAGITIVPSNSMTVDKYIACDISKLNVWEYKPLSVEMGWVNDDFTKNLRTFVGETRLHYYIQANDKTAFLYGDVTDDLTTITA